MARLLVLFLCGAGPAASQDMGALEKLSKFAGNFTAGVVYFAPVGFMESEVLNTRHVLRQVGLELRNTDLDLSIGADLTTGFTAQESSLDLRGSIRALPTITKFLEKTFEMGSVPAFANLGFSVGLSQLEDVRTQIRGITPPDRAVELHGNGFHAGGSVGFSMPFGTFGPFIEGAIRYHTFGSLSWREGGDAIVPPPGWPLTMDLWTGVLRIGIGVSGPRPSKKPDEGEGGTEMTCRVTQCVSCVAIGLLTIGGCEDPLVLAPPEVLTITVDSASITADGIQSAVVEAALPASAPADAQVQFTTSRGAFIGASREKPTELIVRASSRQASARLVAASEPGAALLSATSGGATDSETIQLIAAHPEKLILSADRSIAPADGSTAVILTALLRRDQGTVSNGLEVTLTARDSATLESLPELGRITLSAGGVASFKITSAIGQTVLLQAEAGGVQSNTVTMRFQSPS